MVKIKIHNSANNMNLRFWENLFMMIFLGLVSLLVIYMS